MVGALELVVVGEMVKLDMVVGVFDLVVEGGMVEV